MTDRANEALVRKVLADPSLFPPEFKAWIPKHVENTPTIRFEPYQVKLADAPGAGKVLTIDPTSLKQTWASPANPLSSVVWTAWAPVITQGAGAITELNHDASYVQMGKLVICKARVTLNGAGVGTNLIVSTLPTAQLGGGEAYGKFMLFDNSAGIHYVGTVFSSGGAVSFYRDTAGGMGLITLAANDIIRFELVYEST
jgi:hypothetical protein